MSHLMPARTASTVGTMPKPRRVAFAFPDDLAVAWNPTNPEFSYAANSISLLMPFAEPYFIRSVRSALPELDGRMAERASAFVQQEAQHHRQHRHLNDLLVVQTPALARLERGMARTYGWLGRTRSLRFNLAFAAASETLAFTLARWSVRHLSAFFGGADPVAATVFLWHLAEEVEHKSVAFDVWQAVDGDRLRYLLGMLATCSILLFFVPLSILAMMRGDRRLHRPSTHLHMASLTLSFLFQCLPDLAASTLPRHHPDKFTDPPWMTTWLQTYDPETETMPLWSRAA
jgi:predicted metal-dependent hydrolase